MYDKLARTYHISMWTRNPRNVKFWEAKPTELYIAKLRKSRTTGNAMVAMATLTSRQCCSKAWFLR